MYENTTDFAKAEWTFTLNYGTIGNEKLEFNFTGQDLLTQGFKYITDRVNAVHVETGIRASARSDLATPVRILGSRFFDPVNLSINGYQNFKQCYCLNGAKGALGLQFSDPASAGNPKLLNDVLVLGELTFSKYGSIPTSYSITPANDIAKNQKGVVSSGISDNG